MSFLDNLENNLNSLENAEQGGVDESKRREADRARSLASAPWAEKLKVSPFVPAIMKQATREGFSRRTKINIMWIGTALRLEARGQRLELRPTPKGVVAVFLTGINENAQEPVDLNSDPGPLLAKLLAILDELKRIEDARPPVEILDEE